ncbi:hypothetical protein VQ056_06020 [Paenibacillus sp. JTLBN-2024]
MNGMLKQRKLRDETQWIRPDGAGPGKDARCFKATWEQEFHNRVLSGSDDSMREWIAKSLSVLEKAGGGHRIPAVRQRRGRRARQAAAQPEPACGI